MPAAMIKPTHKAIQKYHAALAEYHAGQVDHEGALRSAFQNLLAETCRAQHWLLIPEEPTKVGGKTVRPDGTLRDHFNLHRGFWEAKDEHDDLSVEIKKKADKGYPLTNTIFEDTKKAVLFQGKQVVLEADLTNKQHVADLLNLFYAYQEPEHEDFERAVEDFKEQIPKLAIGLAKKIEGAHKDNAKFQTAFDAFFTLCKSSLNPNLSQAAVDEMLVQHLLTERLIRTIFNNPDFVQKNVIAREVEKVINALVGKSFSRADFLKALDRFYVAIENAARTMPEFTDKQHFLNTVYERFFQGYSVKVADTHGIVYTPQPIVDFMCASVAEVLQAEFGKKLGDQGVNILDPCTGTGNFIVNLLRRIPKKDLPRMYKEQLFANEVMLMPYYIAALNIEHAYYELTGGYEPFAGLCFVDTLELAEEKHGGTFAFMTEANTERVERQKKTPITVIIGNPPYNVGQLNENDNNKNRKYAVIDGRIKGTYAKDSKATLNTKLYDPYVKFFRWAIDRLQGRDGIVCLVSNNSFVDQIAFDGMRKHLMQDFARLYHFHLEGNVRQNPTLSGTAYNVFGIQVGVGVTVAIRSARHKDHQLFFHRLDKNLRREKKLELLSKLGSLKKVSWKVLTPDGRNTWLVAGNADEFAGYLPLGNKQAKANAKDDTQTIFKTYSLGVSTNRDSVVYDFDRPTLLGRIERFCDAYNSELDRHTRKGSGKNLDDFLDYSKIKWSRNLKRSLRNHEQLVYDAAHARQALYRPFTTQWLYFGEIASDELGQFPRFFPTTHAEQENRVICLTDIGSRAPCPSALMASFIADLHLCASTDGHQCFPFYIYAADGGSRRENITDWALARFREHYATANPDANTSPDKDTSPDRKGGVSVKGPRTPPSRSGLVESPRGASEEREITKWDIFYYVYGLLHHPGYRTKFADNLKRELPRIPLAPPLTPDPSPPKGRGEKDSGFWAFADAGRELARLHLDYEKLEPWPLEFIENPNVPLSYRVEDKMRLAKDKQSIIVNRSLTLAALPAECFEYRLGNRSALEWVIDQYQVKEDKRSGIRSDPNRADDPECIVRLVGQVVRVSVETVRIVKGLPGEHSP